MNILLVCRGFLSPGGSSARWNSLADYLSSRHRLLVVTSVPKSVTLSAVVTRRIEIIPSPIKRAFTVIPFASIINSLAMTLFLFRLLSRTQIDIIVATLPEFEEGIASAIAARRYKRRLIVEIRDIIAEDHIRSVYPMFPRTIRNLIEFGLERLLICTMNSADLVVTVTSTLKRSLLSSRVNKPIFVIPNGADTRLFHPIDLKRREAIKRKMGFKHYFILLYSGAIGVPYYPMDALFEACKIVRQSVPTAKLVLCGSTNKAVQELIVKQGKAVNHLGVLKREQTAVLMQVSDIGLISMDDRKSTFCALTTKLFEYLAAGLPVVAACPKGGELDRLIKANKVGYSVASGDRLSLARSIIQLANDPDQRNTIGQNGTRLVVKNFDRMKLAETYHDLLLKAVNERGQEKRV